MKDKKIILNRIKERIEKINASESMKKQVALLVKSILVDRNAYLIPPAIIGLPKIWIKAVEVDSDMLQCVPQSLKDNINIALAGVSYDGLALEYVYPPFKNDFKVVMEAVSQNGLALQYASKELKNNSEIVMEAVSQNGLALEYASEELKNNSEIVMAAISQNGLALEYANKELRENPKMILTAMSTNPSIIKNIPEDILNSEKLIDELKRKYPFSLVESTASKRKELVDKIVAFDSYGWRKCTFLFVQFLNENKEEFSKRVFYELAKEKDLVIRLFKNRYSLIEYSHDGYEYDEEVLTAAVAYNETNVKYIGKKLYENRDFMLKMCIVNSHVVLNLDMDYSHDSDFIIDLLKVKPNALRWVPIGFQEDPIVQEYVSLDDKTREKLCKETKKTLKKMANRRFK